MGGGLRRTPEVRRVTRTLAGLTASALVAVVTAPVGWAAAAGSPTATPVSRLTASGCNQRVCIYVTGSGTRVTWWSTTAVLPSPMCTFAQYWADGALIYEGNTKCGSEGTEVSSYWSNPGYFAAGTEVCNTWAGVPGRPCETIE